MSADIVNVVSESGMYTSITATDAKSRAILYNAVNDAESLFDHVNKCTEKGEKCILSLSDIVVQTSEMTDSETGEVVTSPRVTLVTDKGPLTTLSTGILSSLRTLVAIMGEPSEWEKPVRVEVRQRRSRSGNLFMSLRAL